MYESTTIVYIFIYNNLIYKYNQKTRLNCILILKKSNAYDYLDKLAMYGINHFLQNVELDDFEIDFIMVLQKIPYYMYGRRKQISESNYTFEIIPITKMNSVIQTNQFNYKNVQICNTYTINNFVSNDKITELKIIDDGVNKFDEENITLLDNLQFTIETLYLLYNINNSVSNLPYNLKKIYVYNNTNLNLNLIKISFGCKLILINKE